MSERRKARIVLVPVAGAAILLAPLAGPLAAADLTAVPLKAPPIPEAYDWTGFYAGGHAGYGWGNSDFTGPPGIGGSIGLAQPLDHFDEAGREAILIARERASTEGGVIRAGSGSRYGRLLARRRDQTPVEAGLRDLEQIR